MRSELTALALFVSLVCAPAIALAQATISGTVRDSSGAILPGVTVEASSPALIEKARTVVTDGNGQYSVVDLRPGVYSVNFTLQGFNTLQRDGIELSGSFAAAVNVEMRVGTIEETIVVSGESPVVDVQSATKQRVMSAEVLDAIPTGRTHYNAAVLIPGTTTAADVGGVNSLALVNISMHGGRTGDTRVMVDGMSTSNASGSGSLSNFIPNMGSAQELTVDTSAGSAENPTGGLRMNLISKEGGNVLSGSFFVTATNSSFQSNNFSEELKNLGLRTPDTLERYYDVNPSLGGPIMRDRLWFYASARWTGNRNNVGNVFVNKNAGNPNAWTYDPDPTKTAYNDSWQKSLNARLTWQAASRHKFSVFWDQQGRCQCPNVLPARAPEAANNLDYPVMYLGQASWTATASRVLTDVRVQRRREHYIARRPPAGDPALQLIPVTEQSTGVLYRGGGYGYLAQPTTQMYQAVLGQLSGVTASVSYVTGSHALKVGFNNYFGWRDSIVPDNEAHMSYRFNNGIPNQLRMNATPFRNLEKQDADLGLYIQDRWTVRRMTVNAGLRWDYYANSFPEQHLGPGLFVPNRNLTIPQTPWVSWKDATPRLAVAYDLFGDAKTAIKASAGKYMLAFGLGGVFGVDSNPVLRMANFVTRNWTDANRNYVPDCDLLNPVGNGECGAMSDANFGKPTVSATVDPALLSGNRGYNWEFSTGIQREVVPRMSVDVSYFRRVYGNFTATDNRAITTADYSPFSVTAPSDARLPNGGGYVVSGLYDLNPDKVGRVDNLITVASNYGEQVEHWNGFDFTVDARPRNGMTLQGGVSTGRTLTDNCEVVRNLDNPGLRGCNVETPFLTQVKLLGIYQVPKIDVQVAGTFQSVPGPQISANYAAPNAVVAPSLGRPLSGGAANVTVNLLDPGTMYGQRRNQLDVRFSKPFRLAKTRTLVSLDLYNALNGNTVLTENANYASWRVPNTILQARFARLSAQFDF